MGTTCLDADRSSFDRPVCSSSITAFELVEFGECTRGGVIEKCYPELDKAPAAIRAPDGQPPGKGSHGELTEKSDRNA